MKRLLDNINFDQIISKRKKVMADYEEWNVVNKIENAKESLTERFSTSKLSNRKKGIAAKNMKIKLSNSSSVNNKKEINKKCKIHFQSMKLPEDVRNYLFNSNDVRATSKSEHKKKDSKEISPVKSTYQKAKDVYVTLAQEVSPSLQNEEKETVGCSPPNISMDMSVESQDNVPQYNTSGNYEDPQNSDQEFIEPASSYKYSQTRINHSRTNQHSGIGYSKKNAENSQQAELRSKKTSDATFLNFAPNDRLLEKIRKHDAIRLEKDTYYPTISSDVEVIRGDVASDTFNYQISNVQRESLVMNSSLAFNTEDYSDIPDTATCTYRDYFSSVAGQYQPNHNAYQNTNDDQFDSSQSFIDLSAYQNDSFNDSSHQAPLHTDMQYYIHTPPPKIVQRAANNSNLNNSAASGGSGCSRSSCKSPGPNASASERKDFLNSTAMILNRIRSSKTRLTKKKSLDDSTDFANTSSQSDSVVLALSSLQKQSPINVLNLSAPYKYTELSANDDSLNETTLRHSQRGKNIPYDWQILPDAVFPVGFIDTHCHLDFLFKKTNFRGTLSSFMAKKSNSISDTLKFPTSFEGCVTIFCKPETFCRVSWYNDLLKDDFVWGSFGCHPHFANTLGYKEMKELKVAIKHPKCVALGEIGLDYSHKVSSELSDCSTFSYRNNVNICTQQDVFESQLKMACENNLPIVIHSRDSHDDTLQIARRIVPSSHLLHIHCFTGSLRQAEEWMTHFPHCFIGVTNIINGRGERGTRVSNVVKAIPLDRLLLETDSPYFTPDIAKSFGEYNAHPGYALHVAAEIARVKNLDIQEVLIVVRQNTKKMYGI